MRPAPQGSHTLCKSPRAGGIWEDGESGWKIQLPSIAKFSRQGSAFIKGVSRGFSKFRTEDSSKTIKEKMTPGSSDGHHKRPEYKDGELAHLPLFREFNLWKRILQEKSLALRPEETRQKEGDRWSPRGHCKDFCSDVCRTKKKED